MSLSLRRSFSIVIVLALAAQLGGCSWWHKRKVRKDFEGVQDSVTTALKRMKDADADVIKARKAMSAASKAGAETDALVDKIHDFAVALQATVPPANAFSEATRPMVSTEESSEISDLVMRTQNRLRAACDHALGFDDIDPCGEAYDEMLGAAYMFEERAKDFEVSFPVVRAPEKSSD